MRDKSTRDMTRTSVSGSLGKINICCCVLIVLHFSPHKKKQISNVLVACEKLCAKAVNL